MRPIPQNALLFERFPPVFHPMLAHCIRQCEAIENATRTELPPHPSLTLLLLGQHHKTR